MGAAPPDAVDAAAAELLAGTRDLAHALRREAERRDGRTATTLADTLRAALGTEARDGWPAQLHVRSLAETLRAPADIGRGLTLRPVLPEPLGAASFARGLGAFGEAFRRAAAGASSCPFALAVPPHFVDASRYRDAFASLPCSLVYQRRGLGLGARAAAQQARVLAAAALTHARGVAVEVLLARCAARPIDRVRFEELVFDVYGEGVPAGLAGAFPRATASAYASAEALLSVAPFLDLLRDCFDEDWFQNPRAWVFLRGRAAGPARDAEVGVELDARPLVRAFAEALG